MSSIAACFNVYNDAKALRGALELSAQYFDDIFVIHSGPEGAMSTDGTIELCESFGTRIEYDSIGNGFGHIRTRLIHECRCDWAFIMDADERFFPHLQIIDCFGTDRYPAQPRPDLRVEKRGELVYPGRYLRELITKTTSDAIRTIRRHWFGFSMTRPAENWQIIKDYQMRIVRNAEYMVYRPGMKMHEQLIDARTGMAPHYTPASEVGGPFHDHFHLHFRNECKGQKEFNEANYQRLERGEPMLTGTFDSIEVTLP